MNSNHKRKWWILGAALAALYFTPQALRSFRETAAYRQRMEALNARAQATRAGGVSAPAPSAPGSAPAPTPNAAQGRLTGLWEGRQAQPTRDLCQIALEMRDNGKSELAGYSQVHCVPMMPFLPGPRKLDPGTAAFRSLTPVAAVLTGTLKEGAVEFHVDRTVGTTFDGCVITSFKVTPFGNDQVAAEWRNGTCGGGQMMLRKIRQ